MTTDKKIMSDNDLIIEAVTDQLNFLLKQSQRLAGEFAKRDLQGENYGSPSEAVDDLDKLIKELSARRDLFYGYDKRLSDAFDYMEESAPKSGALPPNDEADALVVELKRCREIISSELGSFGQETATEIDVVIGKHQDGLLIKPEVKND
jgi:hypothetical protein